MCSIQTKPDSVLEIIPICRVADYKVNFDDANTIHFLLLVGRQEGHPACKKTERRGAGMVICLERGADLHMAQLMMPLPLTVSCFSKIKIGFTNLYLSGTGAETCALVSVCVCC